jgi:hypothetical protein
MDNRASGVFQCLSRLSKASSSKIVSDILVGFLVRGSPPAQEGQASRAES